MDKDTARKVVQLLSDDDRDMLHKAIQDTLTCTASQPSILDEEWGLCTDGAVRTSGMSVVLFDDWKREFSATPDMARALKMVSDKITWIDTVYTGGNDIVKLVNAALEKAGIE